MGSEELGVIFTEASFLIGFYPSERIKYCQVFHFLKD